MATTHVTVTTCVGNSHGVACTCGGRVNGLSGVGAKQVQERHQATHENGNKPGKRGRR